MHRAGRVLARSPGGAERGEAECLRALSVLPAAAAWGGHAAAAKGDEGSQSKVNEGNAADWQNDGEYEERDQKEQGLTLPVNPCRVVETRGFEPPTSRVRF